MFTSRIHHRPLVSAASRIFGSSVRKPSHCLALRDGVRRLSAVVVKEEKLGVDKEAHNLNPNKDRLKSDGKQLDTGDVLAADDGVAISPIYTSTKVPSELTNADCNKYFALSKEDIDRFFGEGLPRGVLREFEETKENCFLVRPSVLKLCKRFQKCLKHINAISDQLQAPAQQRYCLLDGFVQSGKSVSLAMLVHWARSQGWLVFYVPSGKEWVSGGMFYKNEETGLWDTPVQAKKVLEGFLKSHGALLGEIPCRVMKPILLGQGAGVGRVRGPQTLSLSNGAVLKDLVEKGLSLSHAGVNAVVQLREELSLIKEVPVLVVVDEFNSWFTFSQYHEVTGQRSRKPIHAKDLTMVKAFRAMESHVMMAAAFSQSLAVGRLPMELPGVPSGAKLSFPRYSLEETSAALKYYYSRKIASKEPTEEDIKKLFFLTNGNGEELRTLARLL